MVKVDRIEADGADDGGVFLEEFQPLTDPVPQPDPVALQPQSRSQLSTSQRWLLIGLSTCCTLAGIVALSFLWLTSLPPAIDCQKTSPLSADMERLSCAQEAARLGKLPELTAGMHLVEQWTPDHPLYQEAQNLMADWSRSVLVIAEAKIAQSDLKGAIKLANQIPQSSPLYREAQSAIAQWQQQWQKGKAIYAAAQIAIEHQDWDRVSEQILALRELAPDYWRFQQANALSQQVSMEKEARSSLAQAQQLATGPEDLSAAIALLRQIDRKTYVWSEVQPTLNKWSEALLTLGFQQWQQGKLDEAIATARQVAFNRHLSREAHNLILLSQARKLAIASSSNWQPTQKQLWSLVGAVTVAHQIEPKSRFYTQAQTSLQNWQAQLQDALQLQLGQLIASLGQRQALEFAMAQAQQITPHRPQRVQAQTLALYWSREIERLEDSPHLSRAQQLAKPGTVPALRAAIAEASQVSTGRILRGEAQGLVYDWTRQIEVSEDRPFLNMARLLARRGQLKEAIQAAAVIRPGRVLYLQAQAAISDWQADIQSMEITPTPDPTRIDVGEEREEVSRREPLQEEPAPQREDEPPPVQSPQPRLWRHPHRSKAAPASEFVPLPIERSPQPSEGVQPATNQPPPASESVPLPIERSPQPSEEVQPPINQLSPVSEPTPPPIERSPQPSEEVQSPINQLSPVSEPTPSPSEILPSVNHRQQQSPK